MPEATLTATLVIERAAVTDVRDLLLHAVVHNASRAPVHLDVLCLRYAAAVLQVRNGFGRLLPGLPPSAPPLEQEANSDILLAPAAEVSFDYAGKSLFQAPIAPGHYAIRIWAELGRSACADGGAERLESRWVPFSVLPHG